MRNLLLLVLALLALTCAGWTWGDDHAATAATKPLVLRVGTSDHRCADLKWLVSGHKPNVFTRVKPMFKYDPGSATRFFCGEAVMKAVVAWKYRLGWPVPAWRAKTAGKEFFDLLTGKTHWTKAYAATAQRRLLGSVEPGVTAMAARIKTLEVSQLGVSETWGRNYGPQIRLYQLVTGALQAAWCVSFQQWSFLTAKWGTFANRSAGVFATVDWAAVRSYLHAKPKVGALVAFDAIHRVRGGGHMGFVSKVLASGIVSLEGNSRNAVRENFHPFGSREMVYIWLPGVA